MSDAPDRKPFTTVEARFLEAGDEMDMLSEGEASELPAVPTQRVDYFRPLTERNRSRALIAVVAGVLLLGGAALWSGLSSLPPSSPLVAANAAPAPVR